MSYRLDYRRTRWLAMTELDDGWYGGPEIVVRGRIPLRYGYQVSADAIPSATAFIQMVGRAFAAAEPVTLGEPVRRTDRHGARRPGAWVRSLSCDDELYVDADLVALAEQVTGLDAWLTLPWDNGGRGDNLATTILLQGNGEPAAIVAPVRAVVTA